MKRNSKDLTDHISRLREAVKRKYRLFKQGTVDTEQLLEKQYKPIISELKKTSLTVKDEPKDEPNYKSDDEEQFNPAVFSSPKSSQRTVVPSFVDEEVVAETSGPKSPELSTLLSNAGSETVTNFINDTFAHPLTREYMQLLMKDIAGNKRVIDDTYGPYYSGSTLMIGSELLQFEEDGGIYVAKVKYKGTKGLYELLFKRIPDDEDYDEDDLIAYKDILTRTNAHKKSFSRSSHVNRNRSLKYKYIIQILFPAKKTTGSGIVTKIVSGRDISYWDDPNELCERLSLLVASTEAGNTYHRNEILNIVEELKEAKLIRGEGNGRFRSLVS